MKRFFFAGMVLSSLVASAQATVIIDDFSAGPMTRSSDNPGTSTASGLPTTSVIGGSRQMTLDGYRPLTPAPPTISFTVDTSGDGRFVVDGMPGYTPINSGLLYNGSTTATPTMNVNLAPGGEKGLALDFAYADFSTGNGYFDISISSSAGHLYTFVPVSSSPSPFRVFIPYHETSNTLDEHHVTSISIGTGNGYWFNDFALTGVSSVVPEPASLTLLAALIPLAWRGRRSPR